LAPDNARTIQNASIGTTTAKRGPKEGHNEDSGKTNKKMHLAESPEA